MVERVVSDILESNVFVVGNDKECFLVDAAANVKAVAKVVAGRKVLGVLLTHGHYDHAYHVLEYAKEFDCKIYGSVFLKEYLSQPDYNYSEGKFKIDDFSAFKFLKGNGKIKLGGIEIEFFQLGGHSKSDMAYKFEDDVFVGDVLLGRDMGRIDLYGGGKEQMKKSLQFLLSKPYSLMHAGHGSDNTKTTQDKVAKLWLKFLERK